MHFFSASFYFFHNFSPNPLKRITLENASLLLANTICVLVQDLSSKTAFLGVNGQCAIFDNYASRLSKTTHFELQCPFESLFETMYLKKNGANNTAKHMFLLKSVTKPLPLKSRILKILLVFSACFEDRKRLFGSVFDSKLTQPRKGPSCTLAKCFVLYHLGTPFCPPLSFSSFFTIFMIFSVFSVVCLRLKYCFSRKDSHQLLKSSEFRVYFQHYLLALEMLF